MCMHMCVCAYIPSGIFTGVITDQERLWQETMTDDPATEKEARRGGHTPTDITPKMLHDVQVALSRLVAKVYQLIDNQTTNLAECWMHICSKYDGGKVINRSQSGSWEHRCMGAGLQQNMGKDWGPRAWSKMTLSNPNCIFTDTAQRSAKRLNSDKKRKAIDIAKENRRQSKYSRNNESSAARKAYSRHDRGIEPDDIADDVTPEYLEELKHGFYQTKVAVPLAEAHRIERSTRDQADSEEWMIERRKRITASRVGSVAKMRKTTKKAKKIQELLYNKFRGNKATYYGAQMEEQTREQYETYQQQNGYPGLQVQKCGLFISLDTPWLAASPDGLVHDPSDHSQPLGILEIKNPYSV